MASNVVVCAPLQQLKNEHVSLRIEMDRFYETIEEIEYESGTKVIQLFAYLYEQVSVFTKNLKAHSKREDDGLFPMMNRHLAQNDRTIETMEFEHEKAENHLHDFLTEADNKGANINEDDAQTITVYAVQAYTTLTQHFAKEENFLFPLAESILTDDEKAELERLFQK